LTGGLFSPDDAGKGVIYQIRLRPTVIPEPGGITLLALGAIILAAPRLGSRFFARHTRKQ
jgi:hypothetical protein